MIATALKSCYIASVCILFVALNQLRADDVVSIEEHWELRIGTPDVDRNAPQVSMVMSPDGTINNDFFMVTLNHFTDPNYAAGGLQIQHWSGDETVSTTESKPGVSLYYEDEVVTWTQRISINEGQLTFEIADGNSQSWGSFGDNDDLRYSIETALSRLNGYKAAISIGESGITFAGNRVASLTLQKIVWVDADGDVHELVAPIDIDADPFDS